MHTSSRPPLAGLGVTLHHYAAGARRMLAPVPAVWTLLAIVVVVFGAAVGLGAVAAGHVELPIHPNATISRSPALLGPVLGANLGAVAMLFSGVVVAGVTTVLGLVTIGLYVGTVLAASVNAIGFSAAAAVYAPFVLVELAAICAAGVAGLLPALSVLRVIRSGTGRRRPRALLSGYLRGADAALAWLVLATILVFLAGALEVLGGIPT